MNKGQFVQVISGKSWSYGVVVKVFDDRVEIIRENNSPVMYDFRENIDEKEKQDIFTDGIYIQELSINGELVMAKKTLFGKYLFEPKSN